MQKAVNLNTCGFGRIINSAVRIDPFLLFLKSEMRNVIHPKSNKTSTSNKNYNFFHEIDILQFINT